MKINRAWLEANNACSAGKDFFLAEGILSPVAGVRNLLAKGRFDYANWLLVRLLSHKQKVQYALCAAEQVLEIYEKKYPNDDRPRKAIEAAKTFVKTDNSSAAYAYAANAYAAAYAANAAAYADAAYAAYAAAYAADAAAYAANADAAYAANADAAYAANAADAAAYAANAYAANAADAAAYAANAAYAAYAANADAAYAANADAAYAANAADAAAYAAKNIKRRVVNYGLKLLAIKGDK